MRIEWRFLPVSFAQFLQSLKQPAVDEDTGFVCFDQVLRARDSTNTTPEFNTRQLRLLPVLSRKFKAQAAKPTTFSAASCIPVATVKLSPDSRMTRWPSS